MEFDPHALPIPNLGLRCLGCGYILNGLPSHRCPECNREVVLDEYVPPGDFPIVILNGKEVILNDQVKEIMRRAGILFMANLPPPEAIFGVGQTSALTQRLAVERSRYLESIHWLRHFNETGEMPLDSRPTGTDWTCSQCGEENPASFELCWNCSSTATG